MLQSYPSSSSSTVVSSSSTDFNMALRALQDWTKWFSDLPLKKDTINTYAKAFVEEETEEDLSDFSHDLLIQLKVDKIGHRSKILMKAKGSTTATEPHLPTKLFKSDIKLPKITMDTSPSKFRKFLIDWQIYKSEIPSSVENINKLIYSACDEALQNNIINGLPKFLEITEQELIDYIKKVATQQSDPAVYRLSFQKLDQTPYQNVGQYIDLLRDKSSDCEFVCPNIKCKFDYTDFAIRDRLIQGLNDKKMQTSVLTNISKLPKLEDVINHCKVMEVAKNDVTNMKDVTNNAYKSVDEDDTMVVAKVSSYKKSSSSQSKNVKPTSKNLESVCTGCGKSDHSDYASRKKKCPAWGKVCNKCGMRNHFSSVCRNNTDTALALIAYADKKNINTDLNSNLLSITMVPLCSQHSRKPMELEVVADTGANICLAGQFHLMKMGISMKQLQPCKKIISTAGEFKLESFGWINVKLILNKFSTIQPVYFSYKIKRFYMSKAACVELHLLPKNFPHCHALLPNMKEKNEQVDDKSSNIPSRPLKIPFPPLEENIDKLEKYLKDEFSSSAFNTAPPFPAMSNAIPAKIHAKPDAIPHIRHVPIPVALHWNDAVKDLVFGNVEKGIFERNPIGTPIKWCSPMIVVPKKDGRPRIVVDFKKLNEQCYRETHHCPPPFILASQVPNNVKKTIFDAVDGYHAIPLDEESKQLTNFISPWGVFRYCRLPQGYIGAGDAYTRRYDELIAHIPRKVKCIDDVLIWDSDIETAFFRAWDYLSFCAKHGIVISEKKFKFCRDEIEFAGLKVTNYGVAPSDKVLKAIADFPSPTNLTDAQSWFGLVNQVAWAHCDSTAMEPFRELIKPKTPFYWDDTLEKAFNQSKTRLIELVKSGVQAFDTSLPTCLQTDWSKQGMGFVLLQKHCTCKLSDPNCCKEGWKITYAGSRFTTDAESRYSPIEGEATAVAWGLNKSRYFTLGCQNLMVATDHRPLIGIFNKSMENITNPRLIRIKEKTLMFTFTMIHVPGIKNKGADAMSRSPVHDACNQATVASIDLELNVIPFVIIASLSAEDCESTNDYNLQYAGLMEAIQNDNTYNVLKERIEKGFPDDKTQLEQELQEFWGVKDRLSQTENGVILMDCRILVPKKHRKVILHLLHAAHQGVTSMKKRANDTVYWPGMNKDLKNIRENCHYCNTVAPRFSKQPLMLTPDPKFPFQQVAGDFFNSSNAAFAMQQCSVTMQRFQYNISAFFFSACKAVFSSFRKL